MDVKVTAPAQRTLRDRDRGQDRRGRDDVRGRGARLPGAHRRARRRRQSLGQFRSGCSRSRRRARSTRALSAGPLRGIPDRPERHHRYVRHADRDGLADLSRQPAARRRGVRRASAPRRRRDPRQDRHLRICRQRAAGNDQSAQSRAHAGRFVERIGGRGRRSAWCRRRSARKPAARCCGRRRSAGFSATSRPTTPSTRWAYGRRPNSIDTIGWLARSIDDIELLTAVLRMETPKPPRTLDGAPRIGVWRTDLWDTAQQETQSRRRGRRRRNSAKLARTVQRRRLAGRVHRLAHHSARRRSLFTSAPPAWPLPGIIIARSCRRRCSATSRTD